MLRTLMRLMIIKNNKGATIVEFAVVAPLFFMIFFGIVGWAFVMWQFNVLQHATEQAARCSILPKDSNGNKACVSETSTFRVRAAVIPNGASIVPTIRTPDMPYTQSGSSPAIAKSYGSACINVSVPNLFDISDQILPNILRSNYCRPAQN